MYTVLTPNFFYFRKSFPSCWATTTGRKGASEWAVVSPNNSYHYLINCRQTATEEDSECQVTVVYTWLFFFLALESFCSRSWLILLKHVFVQWRWIAKMGCVAKVDIPLRHMSSLSEMNSKVVDPMHQKNQLHLWQMLWLMSWCFWSFFFWYCISV